MPIVDLQSVKEIELAKGIRARVVSTGNVSVAHVVLDEGAVLPVHSHHNEQIVDVIEGELELTVEGRPFRLTPGHPFVLPPMTPHSARAIKKCYVIDIFHPVREDFVRATAEE